MPIQTPSLGGRGGTIALWVVKILVAAVFLYAGGAKLAGTEKMVTEFGALGLGQGFRYLTGTIEVAATVLLLIPATAFYGSVLLIGICGGAFIAQVTALHHDVIHVFVLGVLLLAIGWLTRPAWLFRRG